MNILIFLEKKTNFFYERLFTTRFILYHFHNFTYFIIQKIIEMIQRQKFYFSQSSFFYFKYLNHLNAFNKM